MNLNKAYSNYLHFVIVITFVTSILIISSYELSFAKIDNKNKDADDKDFKKDISVSSMDKNKKTLNADLKEPAIQNNIQDGLYPDQFFICGYPQQIITDYNSFENINCN